METTARKEVIDQDFDFSKQYKGVYKGKRVLLTGHTGFKGSWLMVWLQKLGADVVGFSKDIPTLPSHFELLEPAQRCPTVTADLNDLARLQKVMADHQPEIVFHLAAQSLVRYSYQHPLETLASNVMGTATLLEACRLSDSVKAVVNITSDKCYENNEQDVPFKESDPMGGFDPYSCSKGAAELVASSYRNSFLKEKGILMASARAGNVIGGGDWKTDALIPDIIRAAAQGEVTQIRNPHATRPWQHVLEPLSGYLLLGQFLLEGNEKAAEGWNIGPNTGETLTVADIARISQKSWSDITFEHAYKEGEPYEAKFLSLDISKANSVLNWYPVWSAEQAVDKAIEWYRHYYKESVLLTEQHLAEFSLAAKSQDRAWAAH